MCNYDYSVTADEQAVLFDLLSSLMNKLMLFSRQADYLMIKDIKDEIIQ